MQVRGMKKDGSFKTEDFVFSTLHAGWFSFHLSAFLTLQS